MNNNQTTQHSGNNKQHQTIRVDALIRVEIAEGVITEGRVSRVRKAVITYANTATGNTEQAHVSNVVEVLQDGKTEITPDWSRYITHDVKTPSGRSAVDRDDDVAGQLRGLDLESTRTIASEQASRLGFEWTTEQMVDAYSHLNNGQQRMCIGNRLRGMATQSAKAETRKQREMLKAKIAKQTAKAVAKGKAKQAAIA